MTYAEPHPSIIQKLDAKAAAAALDKAREVGIVNWRHVVDAQVQAVFAEEDLEQRCLLLGELEMLIGDWGFALAKRVGRATSDSNGLCTDSGVTTPDPAVEALSVASVAPQGHPTGEEDHIWREGPTDYANGHTYDRT